MYRLLCYPDHCYVKVNAKAGVRNKMTTLFNRHGFHKLINQQVYNNHTLWFTWVSFSKACYYLVHQINY